MEKNMENGENQSRISLIKTSATFFQSSLVNGIFSNALLVGFKKGS